MSSVVSNELHAQLYGLMPPDVVTSKAALLSPLHNGVVMSADAVTADGSVTVPEVVTVQPKLSVTVTVYVPAEQLLLVEVVEPPPVHA